MNKEPEVQVSEELLEVEGVEGFLDSLKKRAYGWTEKKLDGSIAVHRGSKQMKNFIEHHALVGVQNKAPVWRRLKSYYNRGRKNYGGS